jgi:predicted N-formylglutamate amidohydrolase
MLTPARTLLGPDDPPPFELVRSAGRSPFVIVCDHAGRAFPRSLGSLGVSAEDLATHIAWDIGAAAVAQKLAERLDAFLCLQTYSRLVIDCNRPLHARDSIVTLSGGVTVPGNQGLSREDAAERARAIFEPYHARIRDELDRRERSGESTILIAMHSFTPALLGSVRPWHAGILYHHDARFAHAVLPLLRLDASLVVGENEPYAASEETDYALVQHAERRGHPYVELEIRQDLIAEEAGQSEWAERLARVLSTAEQTLNRDGARTAAREPTPSRQG